MSNGERREQEKARTPVRPRLPKVRPAIEADIRTERHVPRVRPIVRQGESAVRQETSPQGGLQKPVRSEMKSMPFSKLHIAGNVMIAIGGAIGVHSQKMPGQPSQVDAHRRQTGERA